MPIYLISAEIENNWQEPYNLSSLNTSADDFAPSWNRYDNRLYFNSKIDGYSYFYRCEPIDTINFTTPYKLLGGINQNHNNQSYITFLSEKEALLSTFRQMPRQPVLNIYKSNQDRQDWTKPFLEEGLADESFNGQTSLSPSGKILVFTSNRTTGQDTDIWMAIRQENGEWSSLAPLNSLNSPGNEITPFLLSEDTLYFASNGQGGAGGYDLFVAVRLNGDWQRPRPLNSLNTEFDESDFIILPDRRAIFASDRPGGKGNLDLYISFEETQKIQQKPILSNIDVRIKALVSHITISKDLEYQSFQLPYLINLDNLPVSTNRNIELKRTTYLVQPDIDSVYYASFDILRNRLEYSNQKLFYRLPENSAKRDEFEYYLKNQLTLSGDQLNYDESLPEPPENTAILWCSDSTCFDVFRSAQLKQKTTPPVLQLELQGRPKEEISSWKIFISNENIEDIEIASGFACDTTVFIEMSEYSETISQLNEFYVIYNAYDKTGTAHADTLEISLNSMSIISRKYDQINDKTYQDFYVFACFEGFCGNFDNIIEQIAISAEDSENIQIEYFLENDNLQNTAEKIADSLKISQSNIKRLGSSSAPFSEFLLPYVVRVRVFINEYQ